MNIRIKNMSKMVFLLICATGLCPTTAMEKPQMNIGDITPVKDGMNKEQAKNAILLFLKHEVLKLENELKKTEIVSDTERKFGTRGDSQRFVTLRDATKWVGSKDGLQRFLGAHYLQKALESNGFSKNWHAVETKFMLKNTGNNITIKIKKAGADPLKNILTINSDDFISFSRYVGDHRPTNDELFKLRIDVSIKYEMAHACGYFDLMENANLRIAEGDNKVTVIDTEYSSFKNTDKVKPPSKLSEEELGGISFTFSKSELGIY